jgi:hypothetical protein
MSSTRAELVTTGWVHGLTPDHGNTGMTLETRADGLAAVRNRRLFVRLPWASIARLLEAVPNRDVPLELRPAYAQVIAYFRARGKGNPQ